MSRRVLLPCALLALAVLVPCFVGGGTRGGNGRALRVPREGTAVPKATTETPKPKEEPKEPKEPKAETPKSVALVQVTKEKLGEFEGSKGLDLFGKCHPSIINIPTRYWIILNLCSTVPCYWKGDIKQYALMGHQGKQQWWNAQPRDWWFHSLGPEKGMI